MKEKQTKKLYNSITNVNSRFIEEAQTKSNKKKTVWVKWCAISACLCVALVGAFAIPKSNPSVSKNAGRTDVGNESAFHDGEPNSGVPGLDSQTPDNTEISEQISTAKDEIDTSPVYYSNLMLSNSVLNEEVLACSESAVLDIISFDESALALDNCCMIIEGTVTDVYVKHYTFDTYSDKFEENGILHNMENTVVYEVAVDKTWYGEDISGGTILIEDTSYFTEPILAVKEGGRYVLPIYEYGDSIRTPIHEYAGGDIARETVYSTIYPYHPQIEVTNDGSYVVSQDWTTLVANNAKEVIMDTLDDDDFWKDKMYLVDGKTFEKQMAILLSNIK